MEEILIGDKKYISSKQAAKDTGYAKDYIGQLCREGRVPARLVGRNWYVLESAIKDHRFGEEKSGMGREEESGASAFPPTWEAPRYETSEEEMLPSVNKLREEPEENREEQSLIQNIQESWRAWFDRFDQAAIEPANEEKSDEQEEESEDTTDSTEEAIDVPISRKEVPRELLPARNREVALREQSNGQTGRNEHLGIRKTTARVIQLVGILAAVISAATAFVGSGYADQYITSINQVHFVAGVELYNK